MRWLLLRLIHGYRRWISPMLPPACRFTPSCSVYAIEALETHGLVRGTWLATRRICRCNPFVEGGYDPVPPRCLGCDPPAQASSQDR
jgi:putative membrane protein insertion efficiency factor